MFYFQLVIQYRQIQKENCVKRDIDPWKTDRENSVCIIVTITFYLIEIKIKFTKLEMTPRLHHFATTLK